jgi:hypothetical protein
MFDHRIKGRRVVLAVGCVTAVISVSSPARAQETVSRPSSGLHDFDFLRGEWRVHHRRLKPGTQQWVEFEGTCSNRQLMDGAANMEEHALDAPAGAYRALALRAYDSTTGQWAIWWLDGRYPSGPLDPPVKGRFANGIGTFYGDYRQDGKPMRVRFLWSQITPTSARWEQAASADGGKTWATNWIMAFERDTRQPQQAVTDRADANDFDFLVGDWRVRHRYLRVKGGSRAWLAVDGTARHRPVLDGKGNVEEHTIDATGGSYSALALRSFDSQSGQWSIWWLDGRSPHGELDPPVQGRFADSIGTFYGEATIGGKPVRVRFIWSLLTATSARWEQAYSADSGATWEPNWVMEFQRASR